MRLIAAFKDPRIWLVVVLAIVVRVGWAWYWNREFERVITEREAELAGLSPEERFERELQMLDRLASEVAGVDMSEDLAEVAELQKQLVREVEAQAHPQVEGEIPALPLPSEVRSLDHELSSVHRARRPVAGADPNAIPVITFQSSSPSSSSMMPPWVVAMLVGAGVMGIGAVGALLLLRQTEDDTPAREAEGREPAAR